MNRVSFASYKSIQHLNMKTPSSKGSRNKSIASRGFTVMSHFPTMRNTVKQSKNFSNFPNFKGFSYIFYVYWLYLFMLSNRLLAKIDENANFTGLEDGKLTKLLYNKFTFIENAIAFLSLTGMILSVFEFDYNYGLDEDETTQSFFVLMTSTTIILCIYNFFLFEVCALPDMCLIFRHILKLNLSVARGKKAQNETLFSSGQIYALLFDFLIVLPHPSFLFTGMTFSSYSPKDEIYIEYSWNELFSIFIHFRIILVFRAFLNNTIYTQPRAYRICCIYDADFGYLYAIKALVKRYPIYFLLVSILASTLIFSHAVRVCERPFDMIEKNDKMDLGYYSNALWVIVVTMYTIGYGDYYPRSNLGRFVLFFVEIWGNFLISMMVVAIGNLLLLDSAETKALSLIIRLEKRKSAREAAASVISTTYRLRLGVKQKKITKKFKNDHLIKIKRHLSKLKKLNRKLKQKTDGITMFEFLAKNFENFMNDLKTFSENQDKIFKRYKLDFLAQVKTKQQMMSSSSLNANNYINPNDSIMRRREFIASKTD